MADRKTNSPWASALVALGDGLLLLCALLGGLASFLSLYDIVPTGQLSALTSTLSYDRPVVLGGAVGYALAALAAWSLPKFRLPTAAALGAVWAGTAFYFRTQLLQGGLLVTQAVNDLLAERVGWVEPMELSLALATSQQAQAVTLFLAMAAALLALALGWAIVRARRWWLVVLLTLPQLMPGLLSDVYPSWPAFLALCACWCAMLLTGLCRQAAPSGRGRLTLVALPTVAALLAILTLALPQEGYTRPAWTYAAENALVSFGNRHFPSLSSLTGPFTDRIAYVGSADTVDLSQAGPLNYSGRTVLQLSSDYTGRVLLRGSSLAVYTGTSWQALDDGIYDQYAQQVSGDTSPLLFPAQGAISNGTAYSITVTNAGASGSCVYFPYQLADQDWTDSGALPVGDGYLARQRGAWTQTLSFLPDYEDALQSYATDAEADPAEAAYRDYVYQYYLDVPEELADILDQVLRDDRFYGYEGDSATATNETRLIRASDVGALLSELCVYDPDTALTPEGEDFVGYFLTQSRRGYCMHFASAAALLLRTMGVPARYVSGFSAELTQGKTADVPDSAAHAWVEIYLDGYGWYPVDVTPGYTADGDDPDASSSVSPSALPSREVDQEVTATVSPSAAPTPSPQTAESGGDDHGTGSFQAVLQAALQLLKGVAMAAAVVVLIWLGQRLPKGYRAARLADEDADRAAVYGYRCLIRLKKWGGSVPEEALELGRKAKFSQHTVSEEERRAMIRMVDRQRVLILAGLSPVKGLVFRYLWGQPETMKKQEETEDDIS